MTTGTATRTAKPAAPKRPMKLAAAHLATPKFLKGRRSFFKYRDLNVTEASDGVMRAQVMSAVTGMTEPTGWHYHTCDGQFVYVLKGWVTLEFEGAETLKLEAGDSLFIPGGLRHNELATSGDVEILEVSAPAEMGTVPCEAPVGRGAQA